MDGLLSATQQAVHCVSECEKSLYGTEYIDDDARAYGINTIVDATTNECGRNVRFLKKISDMTGMNIICSTGYYFQAESAYAYWNFRRGFANIEEEIYEMMVTELTKGIEGTDIKAGVIKLASSFNEIAPTDLLLRTSRSLLC